MIIDNIYYIPFFGLLSSLIMSLLLILLWPKLFNYGIDNNHGIQKTHSNKSIRLGGLVIFSVLIFFITFFYHMNNKVYFLLISLMPLFVVGLIEDLTNKVTPKIRFWMAIFSSALVVLTTSTKLEEVDIFWINFFLNFELIAFLITVIGFAATANAFNFIDGLNGLSSGLSIIVLSMLIIFCIGENNFEIYEFIILLVFIVIGFFIINIFTGKIFLGDSGAYILGLIIAWIGVEVTSNKSNISSWAVFFLIIYPATELIYSMIRRAFSQKSLIEPDFNHFHSNVYTLLKKLNIFQNTVIVNTFSGMIVLIFSSLPFIYIFLFGPSFPDILYGIFCFLFLYFILLYITKQFILKLNAK